MNMDRLELQDAKRALAEHHERLKTLERDYAMLKARLDRVRARSPFCAACQPVIRQSVSPLVPREAAQHIVGLLSLGERIEL